MCSDMMGQKASGCRLRRESGRERHGGSRTLRLEWNVAVGTERYGERSLQ